MMFSMPSFQFFLFFFVFVNFVLFDKIACNSRLGIINFLINLNMLVIIDYFDM